MTRQLRGASNVPDLYDARTLGGALKNISQDSPANNAPTWIATPDAEMTIAVVTSALATFMMYAFWGLSAWMGSQLLAEFGL